MKIYIVITLRFCCAIIIFGSFLSTLQENRSNGVPVGWPKTQDEVTSKNISHQRKRIDVGQQRKQIVVGQGRKRVVIIWTMMRSGSNFLSQILAHIPNTFSFIEPIHKWQSRTLQFNKGIGQYFRSQNSTLRSIFMNFYLDILHCKLSKYPGLWTNPQWLFYDEDFLLKPLCYGDDSILDNCEELEAHDAFCKGATTVLHKITSIELRNAWRILRDPDLDVRILHLVRDPRGNMASRQDLNDHNKREGMVPLAPERLDVRQTCSNMEDDINEGQKIQLHYPNRYMLLRYEDIMTKGIGSIISWLGVDDPLPIAAAYTRHTIIQQDKVANKDPSYSTSKKSDQVWQRWRTSRSFDWVEDVQLKCNKVLDKLSYRQYNNIQDYKNQSLLPLLPLG